LFDEDLHHHLHRGLKARQITMIAIGGAIGTGLIIGTQVPSSQILDRRLICTTAENL
jgi:L-asparagine transporter-like permease